MDKKLTDDKLNLLHSLLDKELQCLNEDEDNSNNYNGSMNSKF